MNEWLGELIESHLGEEKNLEDMEPKMKRQRVEAKETPAFGKLVSKNVFEKGHRGGTGGFANENFS